MERFYGAKPFRKLNDFTRMPDRSRAPILKMTDLKKVFAELGVVCIWLTLTKMGFRKRSSNKSRGEAEFPLSEF